MWENSHLLGLLQGLGSLIPLFEQVHQLLQDLLLLLGMCSRRHLSDAKNTSDAKNNSGFFLADFGGIFCTFSLSSLPFLHNRP